MRSRVWEEPNLGSSSPWIVYHGVWAISCLRAHTSRERRKCLWRGTFLGEEAQQAKEE
jgi:hypothetical protein